MRKYPILPSIGVVLLAVGCISFISWVVINHVIEAQVVNEAQDNCGYRLSPQIIASIIQVCGLLVTLLLAFFPIQSVAFHQAKKHLLDEILSQIAKYEQTTQEVYEAFYKHQTQKLDAGISFEQSREAVSRKQKLTQCLRDRLCQLLPAKTGSELSDQSRAWWSDILGEDGFIQAAAARLKPSDAQYLNMTKANHEWLANLGKLRVACICEKIKYWTVKS